MSVRISARLPETGMPHTRKTLPERAHAASNNQLNKQPDTDWAAALHGNRAAFETAIAPYMGELLDAARRELRYRIALGDFGPDDLTAEELLGEVLIRAWNDRHRRPGSLAVRTWLLALLFRVAKSLAQRERRFRKMASISLEAPVPPEPIYDDDEEFWEWYQPDEETRWEDVVDAPVATPEAAAAADEELMRGLDPVAREAFLLFELYRVPLPEVAVVLGRTVKETARLVEEARNRLGLDSGKQML
jgi:DNA-directed RNA polymerase specialized sigma24 family protein